MKIMASSHITSWQIDGETMETGTDFICLGSKITVDGDCSHEMKRCLLLGRKAMTNLAGVLKSRDITLPAYVHSVRGIVFSIVTYVYENWTIKKAEQWRQDVFELWFWRILLRVPWTARISNQSIPKEIRPEYSLEGLMLNLQYFGYWVQRADSHWKRLVLLSLSSYFSKTILNIWNFRVHLLLEPGLENFEHYLTSVWDECNCAVV